MANTRYEQVTEEWKEVVDLSVVSPAAFIGSKTDVQLHYSDAAPAADEFKFATLSERLEAIVWSQEAGKIYARCPFGKTTIQIFEG